ncbi:hypothetical protein BCU23_01340 [Vibrio splendidus]|nr:hypothetical protein BCU63_00975 [Vibrio splendidus]PMJ79873.1 hypothetical protein BCU23_01340 [Vibrio splendidus]
MKLTQGFDKVSSRSMFGVLVCRLEAFTGEQMLESSLFNTIFNTHKKDLKRGCALGFDKRLGTMKHRMNLNDFLLMFLV